MSRGIRSSILIVASVAVLSICSAAAAAPPRPKYVPASYSYCLGPVRGDGYSYLDQLYVRHIGCKNGLTVAKHHGRGWQCMTKRLTTGADQYDAWKKCAKGRMRVLWIFTQNT